MKTQTGLKHGVYKINWKAGGSSLASVGSTYDGTNWFAPCNWTSKSNESPVIASTDWSNVESFVPLVLNDYAKRIEVLNKEMDKTFAEWEENQKREDKDLALHIVFVEMPDCVVMDVLRFDWEILGKINEQSNLDIRIQDALGKCSTEAMHKDFQYRAIFDQFAENGAFWGDMKPVGEFRVNPTAFDDYVVTFFRFNQGSSSEILYRGDKVSSHEVCSKFNEALPKPRKFTCTWEEFPREFEGEDFEEYQTNFQTTMDMTKFTASSVANHANKLNKLPVKISEFKMWAE